MKAYIEVSATACNYGNNIVQDDFLIRTVDSNTRIHVITNSNSAAPSAICIDGSNLNCSGNVTACNITALSNLSLWDSNNFVNFATMSNYNTMSNATIAASNSAMFGEGSNFTFVWSGAVAMPAGNYVNQTAWNWSATMSSWPSTQMSNLRSAALSNGWMKVPIKGLYSFDYTTGYTILPSGFQQNWFAWSNATITNYMRAGSSGTNVNNLGGCVTGIFNAGDGMQLQKYNGSANSNPTQWYSSISMTLVKALP